ncbi:hypothetical protein J3E69DRAFT_111065 [Trichoderma sp. SZMC 28015]
MTLTSKVEMGTMILDPPERAHLQLDRLRRIPKHFSGPWLTRLEPGSHSGLQLPAEQTPATDPITLLPKDNSSSFKPLVEQPPDHYREPKKIPGVKPATYAYPHADECISVEHRKRFPVIIDIFQQNLNEHKKLSLKHPTKTEYKLKMCGTGIDDAKPSILVCHPQNDPETGILIIRSLTKSHVRKQYDSRHVKVRFGIYLFLGPAFTYLGVRTEPLNIRMKDASFSGARLVSGDVGSTVSTITCGIKFLGAPSPLFGLTSAHAFDNDEDGAIDTKLSETANPPLLLHGTTRDEESEDEDICVFADVEYDFAGLMRYDSTDEESQTTTSSVSSEGLSKPEHSQTDSDVPTSHDTYITPSRVWGRRKIRQLNHPNLDWALVEMEKSEQWELNNIKLPSQIYNALDSRYESRSVLIMTSRGALKGTICNIPTFLTNSNSNSHAGEVWSVTLTKSDEILVGDSGALVLDALTKRLYGYVIGINHFRELYIMPLSLVLKQFSDVLPYPIFGTPIVFMDINLRPTPVEAISYSSIVPSLTKLLSTYWPVDTSQKILIRENLLERDDHAFMEVYDWENTGRDFQYGGKISISAGFAGYILNRGPISLIEGSFRSSDSKSARKSPEESLVLRDKPQMPQISVLLVDSDPANLKGLSVYMIRHNVGFSAAENGRKAVEFFFADPGKYACILMSTSMPVMDGFEATRQIRAYEAQMGLTPVLIIALSVFTTEDVQQEALESGMNVFLTQPVNPGLLGNLLESRGVLNGSGNRLFPKRLIPSSTDSSAMNSFSSTLLS